jgi:hypothetical protein
MRRTSFLLLVLTLALAVVMITSAEPTSYTLSSSAIANGGTTAVAGSYKLQSTVGQSNVDVLTGNGYQVTSGFHRPASNTEHTVFLPTVLTQ